MSDIKMSDDDLNSWLRNGTNGHIKNNHIVADRMDTLVAQNLALKAALDVVRWIDPELEKPQADFEVITCSDDDVGLSIYREHCDGSYFFDGMDNVSGWMPKPEALEWVCDE